MPKAHVKKEDMVFVISGKDRDRTTPRRVLRVFPSRGLVLVEGVNMVKRHTRPNPQRNVKGGIVEREAPIHLSNVMVMDPETNEPIRVRREKLQDGERVRLSRKTGAMLDKK